MADTTSARSVPYGNSFIWYLPDGQCGNTRGSKIGAKRQVGTSTRLPGAIPNCFIFGKPFTNHVAEWWEPYELRGSRTVLRGARGEVPRVYSPPSNTPNVSLLPSPWRLKKRRATSLPPKWQVCLPRENLQRFHAKSMGIDRTIAHKP